MARASRPKRKPRRPRKNSPGAGRMAMCNGTWVCFDCRVALRRRTWRGVTARHPWLIGSIGSGGVLCRKCRQACLFLGPTVEIPPRRDVRGWKRLRERILKMRDAAKEMYFEDLVRWRHEVERKIEGLKDRPQNAL